MDIILFQQTVKIRKITYLFSRVIKSIICLATYNWHGFMEHYRGPDYLSVLQEYDNELRSKEKWSDEGGSYEDARELFWEVMRERGITIWD